MLNVRCCLLAIVCSLGLAHAQPAYQVGMGSASIEPDASIFSLALAGYGLPREGRFSITWSRTDRHPDVVPEDGMLYPAVMLEKARKVMKKNSSLLAVTFMNDRAYAIDREGKVLGASSSARLKWSAVRSSDQIGRVVSLTSWDNYLYALNRGDSLFSGVIDGDNIAWTMIGRNNATTFNIDVKSIAVAGGRLYALAEDGSVYINEHVTDGNLGAQAMAVRQGDATVVVAVADVCGFEYPFIQAIKEEIGRRHRLPAAAILINATHTHFAPITQDFGPMGPFYENPNPRYMEVVRNGILAAVDAAIGNLAPADLYFGRDTTAIGKNRRASANPDAPYDNTLDVLVARDARDKVTGVLFNAACHPVFRNAGIESFRLSANYPAVARSIVGQSADTPNVIFMQGCGGDINPAKADHRETGNDLAQDVARTMQKKLHRVAGGLSWRLDTVEIPVPMLSRREVEAFRDESLKKRGELEAERNIRWADKMLAIYATGKLPDALPVYVHIIDIGDWRVVGLSREAVNEYATGIRALWPEKRVTVAGYCNDVSSYLPNDWHIRTGIYEGKGSFIWYGAHGMFPLGTYDTIIRAISENTADID